MKASRLFGLASVAALCLLATGCISIEQEIFLNPDGSGEFVFHISLPDLPPDMAKSAPGDREKPEDM
ncbi:MAG TPA: hypothetical protein VNO70_06575, partial [Blastocatellia bacterium]|nr:hypothetical protein [Blastocatellia bacterium]